MRGIRFIPDNCNFDFIGFRWVAYTFSIVVTLGSFILIGTQGLNLGVDFTGGTVIEIVTPEKPDLQKLREHLNGLGLGTVSIQEFGKPDNLLIRMPEQKKSPDWKEGDGEPNKTAIAKVQENINGMFQGKTVDYRRTEFVGPQVGKELQITGLYAIIAAILGISAYVWFRFEWKYGVAAIIALAHDSIVTVGLFALNRMEFDLSTVAAVLLVAGYSINDTVVVFDRIREDLRKYKKKPLPELMNAAINETLSRTILTSLTTLIALFALYLFGGEVIRSFVYALLFGIAFGTYSSIFVASPLLIILKIRPDSEDGKSKEVAEAS